MREKVLLWVKINEPIRSLLSQRYDVIEPKTGDLPRDFSESERAHIRAAVTLGGGRNPQSILDHCPNLKLLAMTGSGYDSISLDECRKRGVLIAYSPGANSKSVADHAMALMLSLMRQIVKGEAYVRAGHWKRDRGVDTFPVHDGMAGTKVGIYGIGEIGAKIAARCAAFEADVQYFSRRKLDHLPYKYHSTLESLVEWCDVLQIAVRAGPETENIVNADILRRLGPSGYLINTTRGSVIDEDALAEALKSGVIKGAALDVFKNEPDINHVLLSAPNLVVVPHQGGRTYEALTAMGQRAVENVDAFFAGKPVPYLVPEMQPK